jgi:hypothetical protein
LLLQMLLPQPSLPLLPKRQQLLPKPRVLPLLLLLLRKRAGRQIQQLLLLLLLLQRQRRQQEQQQGRQKGTSMCQGRCRGCLLLLWLLLLRQRG